MAHRKGYMMLQDCSLNNFAGTIKPKKIRDPGKLLLNNGRASGVVPRKKHNVQESCSISECGKLVPLVI
jgi:hypothetical protein